MMRPDEQANQAEIERDERFRSNLKRGVGAAASIAGGAAASRIMPFLSEYVPVDLALKGLSKVSPHIADFLKRGQSAGLDIKEGMNYVKDLMKPQETKQETPAPEKKNIVEQYSPELHQYIVEETKKGRPLLQVAALAQLGGKKGSFKKAIEQMEKDHKTPWSSIVESIYGGTQNPSQNGGAHKNPSNQTQSGSNQTNFMDMLNKINQKLG
jgi:hypothetical protein